MWMIVRKEWLELRRDRATAVLGVSLLLLLFLALMISWSHHHWYSKLQQQLSENARHHWESQGVKNSHSAAHFGIYLFKPLSPLALWDSGIDKHEGVSVFIEAHKRNQLQFRAVEDNPLLARWGELTPAYVLLFLLPLLIMWLASKSISQERSEGTLKLVLSQGISLGKYVWGKAISLWLIAGIPLLLFWLAGGLLLSGARGQNFFTADGLLLLLVYLVFIGIFIHGSLFVSLLASSQRTAFVSLLALWLMMIWFVPRLSTQVSERLYPSPGTEAFLQTIAEDIAQNGLNGHGGENEKMEQLKALWTSKYGVDSIQQLPVNWLGILLQADEDTNNLIYKRHYQQLHQLYEKQARVHAYSSLLSPLMPARQASMVFSGTSLSAHIDFTEQIDAYRHDFIRVLNNRLRDKSGYNERDTGTVAVWQSLPHFQYQQRSVPEKWQEGRRDLLILLLWLLLSIGLMQLALRYTKIL
jgi:ABC-2 type transport system permease protein